MVSTNLYLNYTVKKLEIYTIFFSQPKEQLMCSSFWLIPFVKFAEIKSQKIRLAGKNCMHIISSKKNRMCRTYLSGRLILDSCIISSIFYQLIMCTHTQTCFYIFFHLRFITSNKENHYFFFFGTHQTCNCRHCISVNNVVDFLL